jgi:hypothetical protein
METELPPRQECPAINVSCTDLACGTKDIPCVFTAFVEEAKGGRELTYKWEVNKGKIVSGQGTTTIKVDVGGKATYGLTATVEVGGLDEGCPNKASCTTAIQ